VSPNKGEGLYAALLRVYPRRVREETDFASRMLEAFRFRREQRVKRKNGLGPGFWAHIVRDVAVSSWNEWRDPLDEQGRPPVGHNRGGDGMRGWMDDLGYAARRLMRSPGFSLTALAILVLGIGVNSTAFSVVNALLFQPPPFEAPEELVLVLQDDDGGEPSSTSFPAARDMEEVSVFELVSSFYMDQGFLGDAGEPLSPVLTEYASASYMDVIGLSPSRGVWFGPEHDDLSGAPVAVLTYRMWADRMSQDPDVIGSTVRVNGGLATVIGVGPPEFNGGRGPAPVDLWLSLSAMAVTGGRASSYERRQDHPLTVRARLADGVTLQQASIAMDGLASDLERTYPDLNTDRGISVLSVLSTRVSPEVDAQLVPVAAFTMGIVVLVLIIGTLNLANLLLVRSTARAREIAVRLALGASRGRVIRVVLAEAVLLSTLGGLGGLGVAALIAAQIRKSRFDFTIQMMMDLRLDGRVVAFTILMAMVTGLIFGLIPALRATHRDVNATLRDDASTGLGSRRRFGLTGSLVAGQVAVSLLLLAVAGVFVESLLRARGADAGFDWENTAFLQVNTTPTGLEGDAAIQLLEDVGAQLEALPMITQATSSLMLPAAQFGTTTLLLGAAIDGTDSPTEIPWNYVALDYFSVMGVPLLHGRLFTQTDMEDGDVAVVSEAFARTYYGKSDVVGETYRSEGSPDELREIVGVVADATVRTMGESPTPSIYWPMNFAFSRMNVPFQYEGSASDALAAAQGVVRQADSRIMILAAASMEEHLGDTLAQQRLAGILLVVLGALALSLAMLGVYGVVSFAVSRRSREVGIRIALGAGGDSVVGLFVRDVAVVVVAGALLGTLLSIPAATAVGRFFTGTGVNPVVTGGAALLLLLTSLGATLIPALRATRTDPTNALRQE
jgi:predicted permease